LKIFKRLIEYGLGCSSRKQAIADDLLVSGRIDLSEEFIISSANQREEILQILMKSTPYFEDFEDIRGLSSFHDISIVSSTMIQNIGKRTHGFSGADLEAFVKQLSLKYIRLLPPRV
jgi:SpoVK/Ycf46/Vps4 family AAA+-type ATPase